MKPKVNLTAIALEAGVSIATVSRWISGKGSVSDATRQRLLTVMEQYDHDPRNLSRGLKRGKTKTVGVVIQQLGHSYFVQAVAALEAAIRERGMAMFLAVGTDRPENEEKAIQLLLEKNVDALVLLGGSTNLPHPARRFEAVIASALERCPVGFLNGHFELPGVVQVRSDEVMGLGRLLDRAWQSGHRQFAYIGGGAASGSSSIRRQTFLDWQARRGLVLRPEWVIDEGFGLRHGVGAMAQLLSNRDRPTVVFCFNDIIASGAMALLMERGYRVPQEVSLLGFDGLDREEFPFQPITSEAQQYPLLARALLEHLLDGKGPKVGPVLVPTLSVEGKTLASPWATLPSM